MSFDLDQPLDNFKDNDSKINIYSLLLYQVGSVRSTIRSQLTSKNLENYIKHHIQIVNFPS